MKRILLLALLGGVLVPLRGQDAATASPWQASLKAEYSRDYDDALAQMNAYRQAGGSPFLFKLRVAWLYYQKKDYANAEQAYRAAEQLQPGSMNPLLGLLNVMLVGGDPNQIDEAAQNILKIDPLNYRALMAIAYQDYLAKDYTRALEFYRKVLAVYPDDTTALSGEAWSLLYLGKTVDAKTDFQTLLGVNGSDSYSQQGLAQAEGKTTSN